MKKSLQTKINKLFCKVFALNAEIKSILVDFHAESEALQEKFDALQEKYDETDEPSDSLMEKLEKAENDNDEFDNAISAIEDVDLDAILDALGEYVTEIPENMQTVTLPEKIKDKDLPQKLFIKTEKREFIPETNAYILTCKIWTDIEYYVKDFKVVWSHEEEKWLDIKKISLPWIGGGTLYNDFIKLHQNIFSELYNSNNTAPYILERRVVKKREKKDEKAE